MLELKNVRKSYPGVKALDDVDITFLAGEVHALLGENGAGKSTLIKIISGFHKADGGDVLLNGVPYIANNTHEAIIQGVHTVYQDLQVIQMASVAENIMLDKIPTIGRTGMVDWKALDKHASEYMQVVGLDVPPMTRMSSLSIGQRQLAEIAKALASDIKILLLDEPTASLTDNDAQKLFSVIKQLKERGVLIIFVSHVLEEVLQVCDRVSILRDGRCVVTDDVSNLDRKKIVKYMIGRDEDVTPFPVQNIHMDQKMLEVRGITKAKKAYDINFELYKGEILGFYGLVGAGRTELAKILIGYDKPDSGEIFVKGEKARIRSIHEAMSRYGIGYVTEDRHKDGLVLKDNIKTNITITIWDRLSNLLGIVSGPKEVDVSKKQIDDLEIKATSWRQRVGNLSGGNQQKVNVGKWLAADSEILIIDEPTVGVDVGAKEYFCKLIWDLADSGKSIILISSDMPEIIKLANRILVFSGNHIVGEVDNTNKDYQETSQQIGDFISEFHVSAS
ncbi:sugar ABC transporter ATP-binding protein [Marispirochaeta aestuarii]|uniref:sugar ABC transporter ATP-binding protein n=1 Tax=Marispirochaeta aestuarii TaxID=1963862 RepID=UPI0029C72238|nr:sugar ABC transporter ATP-binding protein [Marispirochaeta aestuarii]